jgi:pimeloyl-ACP methyl ester carboxylesterase
MTAATALVGALAVAVGLYVGVLAWLWWYQEKLLFAPTELAADVPLARSPDVQERWIDVPGARLSALHLRLPDPKGVVFFLHGNGGSLENWFVNTDLYRRANVDLFMLDYRGYGKSSGRIQSQAQLQADVRLAWEQIAPQYAGRRVVVYGRSLGTYLAAALSVELAATARAPDLTVLVSPYTSMQALTAQHYPWVPPFVLRYPLRTDALVAKVPNRLLLIHGTQDSVIPQGESEALLALAPGAELLRVPGAAHNDLQDFPVYVEGFAHALGRL